MEYKRKIYRYKFRLILEIYDFFDQEDKKY